MKRRLVAAAILAMALAAQLPAAATADDLVFAFDESSRQTAPGGTVSFVATISNNTGVELFLNSNSISLVGDWTGLAITDHFFTDVPWPLAAGETWSSTLLDVSVDPSVKVDPLAYNLYTGSYLIWGGSDASALDTLGGQDFQTLVVESAPTPVPEPSSLLLALCAVGGGALWRARRRGSVLA